MKAETGKRTWLARAGVFGGAAMLAAAVTACASPGGAAQGGAAGGGQPTVSATSSAPAGALPKPSCGSALTHGLNANTRMLRSDKGALTCFQAAAKSCKTASLAVTEMGVDTGINNVLAIAPSGSGCQVTWWHQGYSANGGGSKGTVGSTACQLGTVTTTGVTLSCAGEKVLVPVG